MGKPCGRQGSDRHNLMLTAQASKLADHDRLHGSRLQHLLPHLEACFKPRKTPRKLTAWVRSKSSMLVSNRSCVWLWKQMPALLTCADHRLLYKMASRLVKPAPNASHAPMC